EPDPTADAVGDHPPPLPGLRKFVPANAEVVFSVILIHPSAFILHPFLRSSFFNRRAATMRRLPFRGGTPRFGETAAAERLASTAAARIIAESWSSSFGLLQTA
ncbi:MAG: hypothetical protein ACREJB_04470, partial [Planctomycetaceae bacterium]